VAKNKKGTVKDEITGQGSKPLILLFLLLSGSCGLIYEIVWMKMLTLVIGNTVFTITTVLTAFMGGLALGSHLAGRLEGRIKQPLKIYGLLEGGIGVYALLLPVLIAGTEPFFRVVYQHIGASFYFISLLRFVICGLLLLVPTILMGATLPVLSKYFLADPSRLARTVGLLYGVNSLGAVLGSLGAGFVLIPALGISRTIYTAALINILIAAFFLWRFKDSGLPQLPAGNHKVKKQKQETAPEIITENPPAVTRVVMAAAGVSGLAAMIYQIAWTRVLLLAMGSSVYAFSLIVTAFICGLALGSLVITRFIDRRKDRVLILALLQGVIGLSALGILHVLGNLSVYAARFLFDAPRSFQYIQLVEFAVIFGLVLVPTFMMGATVPVAVRICTPDARQVGKFFGNVYAINTLGAIIGSFAAGFILIPWLGARNSILTAVAMNILMAGILFLRASTPALSRRVAAAVATAVIAGLVWYPLTAWDASVLSSGPFLYTGKYKNISARKGIGIEAAMKDKRQLIYFREGLHALVSVEKSSQGDVSLGINGKIDASAKGGDVATQLMIGHLPLLLHQGTQDVLMIGLGSGMTLGAVERHPVKSVDVVEIEAAVVEASQYFREFTGDVLDDPRARLIVADGRNHLALTSRLYDVIISEPSNPWVAGMANLFTREFFELAKQRLREAGLMCQWVQAYSMSSMDFKTIVRTFHSVFPHVTVWEAAFGGDYLLIGSPREVHIDLRALSERLVDERLRADLGLMRARGPAALMSRLIMTEAAIPGYIAGVPLHTDDNALLEYSAPRAILWQKPTEILAALYAHRQNPVSALRSGKSTAIRPVVEREILKRFEARKDVLAGFTSYMQGAAQAAVVRYEHALAISPQDYDATHLLAKLYYEIGNRFRDAQRPAKAIRAYEKSAEAIDNFIRGNRELLADHFKLDVIYSRANLHLGTMVLKADRLERAAAAFGKSISGEVRYADAHNNMGIVYERLGEYEAALNQYRLALKMDPSLVFVHMNMGNTLLKQEKYEEAIQSYRRVQKLKPDFALTHYNLGVAYFRQNEWDRAEKEWEQALVLAPDYSQARKGLEALRSMMKDR